MPANITLLCVTILKILIICYIVLFSETPGTSNSKNLIWFKLCMKQVLHNCILFTRSVIHTSSAWQFANITWLVRNWFSSILSILQLGLLCKLDLLRTCVYRILLCASRITVTVLYQISIPYFRKFQIIMHAKGECMVVVYTREGWKVC